MSCEYLNQKRDIADFMQIKVCGVIVNNVINIIENLMKDEITVEYEDCLNGQKVKMSITCNHSQYSVDKSGD